ncbi:thiamine transporter [Proteiniborus ethanoligenes]|uniref:Thiamine transporter n=1 Tax=Proteiniborus ethanoligenes TaxID=415015 RepID=A0A1H3PL11_9FIRM|nr:energy-coupled thiamine transporter ThiT [Proteiniborus ethanoligenes]TAH64060.1 MAG: energy-coupled thiamine transporter ThiT [Gottschalkiaceae bacterium]SDZ01751.1 thiamine transporter [Proteiniborus ethanoligenes]
MVKNKAARFLAESGIMIALATVLSMIPLYKMPFGGSVTAGSMIPIILIGIRWGTLPGLLAGTVYGLIQAVLEPYIVHPLQFLLDYPIAFGLLGLSGMYRSIKSIKPESKTMEYVGAVIGVFIAIFGRFISHVLSGVVYFSENAKDLDSWSYSLKYNGGYLGVELIVSIIIIMLIWKPIRREIK